MSYSMHSSFLEPVVKLTQNPKHTKSIPWMTEIFSKCMLYSQQDHSRLKQMAIQCEAV